MKAEVYWQNVLNIVNEQFFDGLKKALKCIIGNFDESLFLSQIIDDE